MKLDELLKKHLQEMPNLDKQEINDYMHSKHGEDYSFTSFFITDGNLKKRSFRQIAEHDGIVVLLREGDIAYVGTREVRRDGKSGIKIFGFLEFKSKLNLGYIPHINSNKLVQVSLVEVDKTIKLSGLGSFLYSSMVQAGYSVVSDNLQFLGGQAVWKKIARDHLPNEAVYVIDHGNLMTDDSGKPIEYDGSNIPDNVIWDLDEEGTKEFVLLVYTQKV